MGPVTRFSAAMSCLFRTQILAKGEMQVSDKERKSEYDTLFKASRVTQPQPHH